MRKSRSDGDGHTVDTRDERIEMVQVLLLFCHLVGRYGYPFSDNLVCSYFFSGLLMLISNKFDNYCLQVRV